jgi:hypothetical protein
MRETNYLTADYSSWPRGVECIIEYDTLRMNDHRTTDRICVEEVGGLDDPDVVDAREKSSDRDGETPYDSFYSGRTITLKGYVEAGNLARMRYLLDSVKDVFDDLTERRLTFLWTDWREYFFDSLALADYTYDSGSGLTSSSAGAVPASTALKRITLSVNPRFTYTDSETVIKVTPSTSANQTVLATMARLASNTYLALGFEAGILKLRKTVAGTPTDLASNFPTTTQPPAGTAYWIRGRKEGNILTVDYWVTDPDAGGSASVTLASYTLAGGDATQFGSGVTGLSGMEWTPVSTSDRVNLLDIASLNPGDHTIYCRKVAKIDSPESQTGPTFRRDFLITLRASDPRLVSRKTTVVTVTPTSSTVTFPGGGTGIPFDSSGAIIFGAATPAIVNLGRSPAATVVRFNGPMTNPGLLNATNGGKIGVVGSILTGDYLEFNSETRRIVDSAGVSRYDLSTDDTTKFTLERGSNTVYYGADTTTGTITITYRHSSR